MRHKLQIFHIGWLTNSLRDDIMLGDFYCGSGASWSFELSYWHEWVWRGELVHRVKKVTSFIWEGPSISAYIFTLVVLGAHNMKTTFRAVIKNYDVKLILRKIALFYLIQKFMAHFGGLPELSIVFLIYCPRRNLV